MSVSQSVYLPVHDRSDLANFRGELRELFGQDGLNAIGERFVGVVMDFDEQAIGADSDRGSGKWQHLVAFSSAVTGIDKDRQMAALFNRGHHRQIEGVARKIGKRTHAAFAKHYVVIAF